VSGGGIIGVVPEPRVSIIMVNWNTLEVTTAALESLRAFTRDITYEVTLVDNGSTRDASATELPRRLPWVRFIANRENLGFSAATNQGLRLARGEYLLLLNNDTLHREDSTSAAVGYMDRHPEVGILGIRHMQDEPLRSHQPSAFELPDPLAEAAMLIGLRRARPTQPILIERDVGFVCGSFLMMRRACFQAIGTLDERFFVYDEDVDLCQRAWKSGWRVRYWPGASIVHLGATARQFLRDKSFMHHRSHLTYLRKNHSFGIACLFYFAMTTRLAAATVRQLGRFVTGHCTGGELMERLRRQVNFMLLRSGRCGLGP
jgi:GT2 family glycosyltransferase